MNLDLMIQKHARETPDKLALGWDSGTFTYKELDIQIDQAARKFLSYGINKGDRIGIILMNCPEFILTYYACMRIGAISVPINPMLTDKEFNVIIEDCAPTLIVTTQLVYKKIEHVANTIGTTVLCIDDGLLVKQMESIGDVTSPSPQYSLDLCTIIYTSGTTGIPKGAVLTHDNLYTNARDFSKGLEFDRHEKTLIVAPVFHTAAQTCCLNSTIYAGGYCYLIERWISSEHTLETMEREKITFFFGPPTMYTYMLNDPNLKSYNLHLRIAFTGAAALPEEVFKRWKEIFSFEIVEGYGLSETSPVVTFNPLNGIKKPGSIGIPMKPIEVKLIDENGKEVGVDQPGELLVKGPNVMRCYWNKPEENESAFKGDWFCTGDIAQVDIDGYYYIVDRKKDMINRSGFKVYPRQVEEVLYTFPSVLEVSVIGVPDDVRGERVLAVMTIKEGHNHPSQEELKDYCKDMLAPYKIPSQFEIVDELPKTGTGKILKTELRKIYA